MKSMTIDEQLNKFEKQLENFVPETPKQQKLLKEASASLSAFRVYAEKEGLLPKEITSDEERDEEREMWLRRSVLNPMLKLWKCRIDENRHKRGSHLKIGEALTHIKDDLLYPP
jgi:hypothetical protein